MGTQPSPPDNYNTYETEVWKIDLYPLSYRELSHLMYKNVDI
jgi:hypothetical protein